MSLFIHQFNILSNTRHPFATKKLCSLSAPDKKNKTEKLIFLRFLHQCSDPSVVQISQSNFETGISVVGFNPLLCDHHGPLDLLKWDKHHNIPRSQPQKRGHKSTRNRNKLDVCKTELRLDFAHWCWITHSGGKQLNTFTQILYIPYLT